MSAMVKAVDYDHLKVQAAGDLGVMREVLSLFVTHTEQVLRELEAAEDAKTWKQWTHTLKGSARGVGAFAVAEAAADAERRILDKSAIAPIRTAFEDVCAFIGKHPL